MGKKGFVIFEALIAAAALSIFAYIFSGSSTVFSKQSSTLTNRLQAVALAKFEAEKLAYEDYALIQSEGQENIEGMAGFAKSVNVSTLTNSGKKVKVTVTYPEGSVSFEFEKYYSAFER